MTNFSQIRTAPTAIAPNTQTLTHDYDASDILATTIAQAADDRKGADIVLLDVAEVSYIADYLVIITGFSSVQVRAIAHSIEDRVQQDLHRFPRHVEGQGDGNWVLMDYGDVIAHIFLPHERDFYNLEAFWGHAKRTPFESPIK